MTTAATRSTSCALVPGPTVAIIDLAMPVVDGWEVLAARACDPELSALPVVVVSGQRGVAERVDAAHATFLAKPVAADQLLSLIERFARTPATGAAP